MSNHFASIAFTPHVRAVQAELGSRRAYERWTSGDADPVRLGPDEQSMITTRDSFYLASVSETGWPYVQHRGGPPGFLKVLDEVTIGCADYRGNRQYVTVGNARTEDRVAMILMDYPSRTRLKVLGRLTVVDVSDPDTERMRDPQYPGRAERFFRIRVEAFDWNCPQHITPRYTLAQIEEHVAPLHARIAELERALAAADADRPFGGSR